MPDEEQAPYSLMCSACCTPCPAPEAHVIPRWNPQRAMVVTAYRCGNCWRSSLSELRALVTARDLAVHTGFCDFLARHGYTTDAETIRAAPDEQRQVYLLRVLDAVEAGALVFEP